MRPALAPSLKAGGKGADVQEASLIATPRAFDVGINIHRHNAGEERLRRNLTNDSGSM